MYCAYSLLTPVSLLRPWRRCKGLGVVGEIIVGLGNGVLRLCSSIALCREKENLSEKESYLIFLFPLAPKVFMV